MPLPAPRSLLADASWAGLRRQLEADGAAVFELDCPAGADGAWFLRSAALALPADPAQAFTRWSALADALWSGLANQPARTVVYAWRHVEGFLAGGLAGLLDALDVAGDLQRSGLAPETSGLVAPIELYVVLTGDGQSFPEHLDG